LSVVLSIACGSRGDSPTAPSPIALIAPPPVAPPIPNIKDTWGLRVQWGLRGEVVGLGEGTFTQNDSEIFGAWRTPNPGWEGAITGHLAPTGTITGTVTFGWRPLPNIPSCSQTNDLDYGLLDETRNFIVVTAYLSGPCADSAYHFEFTFMRQCRLTERNVLSCTPVKPSNLVIVVLPQTPRTIRQPRIASVLGPDLQHGNEQSMIARWRHDDSEETE
jgi:hypothetical protein